MKETLYSRYERYITTLTTESDEEEDPDNHYIIEGQLEYKALLKEIHTNEVRDALTNREDSKVLGHQAPKIHKEEMSLPRGTRRTLAHLRSGYSLCLV